MGELGLGAGFHVANPEVPIAEEGGAGAVGRGDGGGANAAGGGQIFEGFIECAGACTGGDAGRGDGAAELPAGGGEGEGLRVAGGVEVEEFEAVEVEVGGLRRGLNVRRGGEYGGGECSVVEGGRGGLRGGIDQHVGGAVGAGIAIPEAVAGEEGGIGDGVGDERVDFEGEAALGEAVVGVGEGAAGALGGGGDGGGQKCGGGEEEDLSESGHASGWGPWEGMGISGTKWRVGD